jgi:hypothetical protein
VGLAGLASPLVTALEGDRGLFGQHLEVGSGHLGEAAIVDAAGVGSDDARKPAAELTGRVGAEQTRS